MNYTYNIILICLTLWGYVIVTRQIRMIYVEAVFVSAAIAVDVDHHYYTKRVHLPLYNTPLRYKRVFSLLFMR